jgi:hypothetical protein
MDQYSEPATEAKEEVIAMPPKEPEVIENKRIPFLNTLSLNQKKEALEPFFRPYD